MLPSSSWCRIRQSPASRRILERRPPPPISSPCSIVHAASLPSPPASISTDASSANGEGVDGLELVREQHHVIEEGKQGGAQRLVRKPYLCSMVTDSVVPGFFVESEKILWALRSDPAVEDFLWQVARPLAFLIRGCGIKLRQEQE
ncbi:hypothetical protein LINPERPRIM_LOCUS21214 [Linum perenne]